jgi:hypothetical protein
MTNNHRLFDGQGLQSLTVLETSKPIPFPPVGYTPLGSEVTEVDLRDHKIELNDLYNELEKVKTIELTRRENLLKKGQKQLLLAKERVQEKIEHMKEVGNKISEQNEKLRGIEDEISVYHSTTAI